MSTDPLFDIAPLEVAARMPERITKIMRELIVGGTYPPKTRLPSEGDMAQRFGVSRTVMREAVSRLKAEGLVESRQGSGVFVSEAGLGRPFRIEPSVVDSVQEVLQVAELRRGMEAECAALAAERATKDQIAEIGACLAGIDADVASGGDGVAADLEFHRSIARATGNPHFLALWDYLGQFLKGTIKLTRTWEAQRDETKQQVLDEHRAVYDAIVRRDANAARDAARRHMEMSSQRIRNIDPTFVSEIKGPPLQRMTKVTEKESGKKPLRANRTNTGTKS